jgi:hypothetical protein
MKLKVKEDERLVRDSENFAILNTDKNVVSQHQKKMQQLQKQKAQEEEINTIKRDVSEIKDMLRSLLQQRSNP